MGELVTINTFNYEDITSIGADLFHRYLTTHEGYITTHHVDKFELKNDLNQYYLALKTQFYLIPCNGKVITRT